TKVWPPEALRSAVAERVRPSVVRDDAAEVARAVVAAGGGSVRALVFFGSRKTQARPDAYSAYDLFVVVAAYAPFYRALRAAGRPERLAAAEPGLRPRHPRRGHARDREVRGGERGRAGAGDLRRAQGPLHGRTALPAHGGGVRGRRAGGAGDAGRARLRAR